MFLLSSLCFLAGASLLQLLPALPPTWLLLAVAAVAMGMVWRTGHALWWLPLSCVAGLCLATAAAAYRLQQRLPDAVAGQEVVAEGRIVSLPEWQQRRLRFEFSITHVQDMQGQPIDFGSRVRVSWYASSRQPLAGACSWQSLQQAGACQLQAGAHWRLRLRLRAPRGLANPALFDYERWLFGRNIHALASVRQGLENGPIAPAHGLLYKRQQLLQGLQQLLQEHPNRGFLYALLLGFRAAIDDADQQRLVVSGTLHLLAISGLHIGLVAWFGYMLGGLLLRPSAFLSRHLMRPRVALVCALLVAVLYAAMAGFSIPTQRALIMLFALFGGDLLGRPQPPWRGYALALYGVLLWQPLAPLQVGFWLSFAAVAALLYAWRGPHAQLGGRRWQRLLWLQCVLLLFLLPLSLFFFQRVSWGAPLANLLAVPWVGLVVLPWSLLAALWAAIGLPFAANMLSAGADLLTPLWYWLDYTNALSATLPQRFTAPPLFAIVLCLPGLLWLFAPAGIPSRWLGLLFLLPLFWRPVAGLPQGAFSLQVIDVGQGSALLLRTRRHALLYDSGPAIGGKQGLLPAYLRQQGVAALDMLLLSHQDSDHSAGTAAIMRALPVQKLRSGEPGGRLAYWPFKRCVRGQEWHWDGVDFAILHPDQSRRWRGNNVSCVLRVSNAAGSLLLTGDIGRVVERHLLALSLPLSADVLLAPHHGSKSSSSGDFLDAVAPRWAIVSAGYQNRFGLPAAEVMERYRQRGIAVLNTAESGHVEWLFDRQRGPLPPTLQRQRYRRYWQWPSTAVSTVDAQIFRR